MEKRMVKLNSYEQTAYWWVRVLRGKVDELYDYKRMMGNLNSKEESEFLKIFGPITEEGWRKIYLALTSLVQKDVESYVPQDLVYGHDVFWQDTDKGNHRRINAELSQILGVRVPDIRLANSSSKDWVIYTSEFEAVVWYKSCGEDKLDSEYDASYNYVLTGDLVELDFYRLLLSTIIAIMEKNSGFDSMEALRSGFCGEYQRYNNLDTPIEELVDRFNAVFLAFNRKNVITDLYWRPKILYFPREKDKIGLEAYKDIADHYSNVILGAYQNDGNQFVKTPNKPS